MKAPGKQTNRDPLLSRWLQRQTLSAAERAALQQLLEQQPARFLAVLRHWLAKEAPPDSKR